MPNEPELVVDAAAIVGEGPHWASSNTLLWVDILGRKIFRFDPDTGVNATEFEHPDQNVAFVLEEFGGGLLVGFNKTIHVLSPHDISEPFVQLIEADAAKSLNDATVDPAGNLWVGVYDNERARGEGSLWRVTPEAEATRIVDGLTLPNGIAFSPDGTEMYLADSFDYSVLRFGIDVATGQLSDRRVIWRDETKGLPDGLCVDVDGNLWVAFWGGSCVRVLSPDGREIAKVNFPVTQVASCAFATNGLLYATTARAFLDEKDLANQPLAGGLFRVHAHIDGVPIPVFGHG